MSNLATVTHLRPSQRPVERRVAEVEDGYTRLANALYEELIGADLTKNQSKVAHAICRKTYGYGKKMDRISDSQLAQITRLPRQKVNKAKNELIAMKVILREGQQIGPNKNIEEWQIEGCHYSGDNVTALVTKSVTKTVTALSPKQGQRRMSKAGYCAFSVMSPRTGKTLTGLRITATSTARRCIPARMYCAN